MAFASEIKAFFGHPDISIELDPEAVPSYFIYGYVPGPATFYKRVSQLEPGTLMTVDAGGRIHDPALLAASFPGGGRGAADRARRSRDRACASG